MSAAPADSPPVARRHVEQVMGMPVSFVSRSPLPDAVLDEAISLLHDVDATFSTYKAESEISRLGRGELAADDARPDVLEVLEACEGLRVDTGGWFDAWVSPVGELPHLDPSGYVKGWAVGRAADVLEAGGVESFCLNAGGDIVCRSRPGEPPWRVGIRHPTQPMDLAAVVAAGNLAVATSATYERGLHILDPHTGRPPVGVTSLTVIGDDLAVVDAYATAAFAMGADGPAWVAGRPGFGVFAVTDAGRTLSNPVFDAVRVRGEVAGQAVGNA